MKSNLSQLDIQCDQFITKENLLMFYFQQKIMLQTALTRKNFTNHILFLEKI